MLSLADFSTQIDATVFLLTRLIETESPSGDKAAIDRVGALIATELSGYGAQLEVDPQTAAGDHLIARWPGSSRAKGILFLSHMDTVHPLGTLQVNPCVVRDGKLFGPGAQDMKGGIAILLAALRVLHERGQWPARPVTALFTSDEEVGSVTSRALIERLAREAELVVCLEPCLPGGALKTARKGVGDFEVIARGQAAHAGAAHDQGRNAIEELAHQVIAIQSWTDYTKGTTLNAGVIQGGTVSNVVPAEARLEVDFRVTQPEEAERILAKMQALRPVLEGASLEVRGGLNRPPMPRDAVMVAAFQKAQGIAARLGLKVGEGSTGGGSDANFIAPLGIPVLDGLGPEGDGQHSNQEYIQIASLPERAALLAALLSEW